MVDRAANPATYVPFTGILEGINDRANAEGALNLINEAALDPYIFTRESFLQYRQNLINDGNSDRSYDPDFDEVIEDSAELDADNSDAVKPVVDTASISDDGIRPASKPTDKETVRSSAFDNMVQASTAR
ncbi:MAG: MlaA family lipoprotein [Gammaproteobacteria bacterium]